MIKLDYSLQSPEERKQLVEKILEENPNPNEKYLEVLANYLVFCMEKQEKKEKAILTDNRMTTVNKRETSYEGLVSQLENGEDGIYNLINESKQIIFQPKMTITKKDLEEIPELRQIREAIELWEKQLKTSTGKDAYIIKKTIIDLRKQQYVIKNSYRQPINITNFTKSEHHIPLNDTTHELNDKGYPIPEGISLLNPKVCSAILCNYSRLKQDSWDQFKGDTWYLMQAFDAISEKALKDYPMYQRIVELKIDGLQNIKIQEILEVEFEIKHSLEYISSLWRNKIPKMIASVAEDEWLDWYY